MKHWKLALVAFLAVRALAGCASTPKTPEEIAADQALAMRILAAGAMFNAMQPPMPAPPPMPSLLPQTVIVQCPTCR